MLLLLCIMHWRPVIVLAFGMKKNGKESMALTISPLYLCFFLLVTLHHDGDDDM